MSRLLASPKPAAHGHLLVAGEPMIFHCNHYNYWLQKTVLEDDALVMENVIRDAAASVAYNLVTTGAAELGLEEAGKRCRLAADTFAQHGFGIINLEELTADGGRVTVPTSHYGQCFSAACDSSFTQSQNLFDQGFAAGAAAAAFSLPAGSFAASCEACHSMGATEGIIQLSRRDAPADFFTSPGLGKEATSSVPAPNPDTAIDEPAILQALAGIDFSGNEEGLIPRFGVMLTLHFANFYNRISFELVRRTNTVEEVETRLVAAGHRCAFNTFGGIMTSPEWDAVVAPQCKTRADWVHGMIAVTNALGWGVWRVAELSPERLVVRIYDDYESRGYLGMYGTAGRPSAYLAQGGVAGVMNLIYCGQIDEKPELNQEFYNRISTASDSYVGRQTKCLASGDEYTEVIAERRS